MTPQALAVDSAVRAGFPAGANIYARWSGTLYGRERLPFSVQQVPSIFSAFKRALLAHGPWNAQLEDMLRVPKAGKLPLPKPGALWLEGLDYTGERAIAPDEEEAPGEAPGVLMGFEVMPPIPRHSGWMGLAYEGGEKNGLSRLWEYTSSCHDAEAEAGERTGETLLGATAEPQTLAPWFSWFHDALSTRLSPWLANGCLSPRMVAADLSAVGYDEPVLRELLTRDFYRFTCAKHGELLFQDPSAEVEEPARYFYSMFVAPEGARLVGPQGAKPVGAKPGSVKSAAEEAEEDERLLRWKQGRTGMPLIDANMREIGATGYMSHRGRQNVASYLTVDLGVDWRKGAEHFQSLLIDFDVCSNWGNWAMVAGLSGGDPVEPFDTVAQSQTFDSDGEYLRFWVHELRGVPAPQVHEPWLLSKEQQASDQP